MRVIVGGALALSLVCGCTGLAPKDVSSSKVQAVSDWVYPLRTKPSFATTPFERTKPILLGEILLAADQQGRVVAIHRTKGFILWETKLPHGVNGTFGYGRSLVIAGDRQGNLVALHPRDGSEAWKFKIPGEWLAPPTVVGNKVFAVSSSGDLYALSESKGEELWHYARRGDEKMTIWGSGGPVAYGTGEIYVGFSDGTLVALSTEKGRVLWERPLRGRERFHDVDMTPYVDEKRVVVATFDGQLHSVDRISGETLWVFPVGSYSGFLVSEGRVYFAGINRQFYALDLASGHPVWTTPYEGGVGAQPLLVKGVLVFNTSSDPTYLLDQSTGKILSELKLGAGALSGAVGGAEDGWFYTLSNYANLYAFELVHSEESKVAKR